MCHYLFAYHLHCGSHGLIDRTENSLNGGSVCVVIPQKILVLTFISGQLLFIPVL